MKTRYFMITVFVLIFILAACNSAEDEEVTSVPNSSSGVATAQPEEGMEAVEASAAECPDAPAGAHQLIAAAQGVCFVYPDNFDVFEHNDGSGFTLYVRSLLNHEAPAAIVTFGSAGGKSLDDITSQYLTDYAFPDTEAQAITLGGKAASMLDNLPGQDTNRRVVAVNDDSLVDITITRIGPDYGPTGEEAEDLYSMITSSFHFIDVDPEAELLAGPECPEVEEDTMIYTNEPGGYCLLVPAAYTALQVDPEAMEVSFFMETIQDVSHPRLFVKVEDAGGRSLEEVTAAKEAEIEDGIPGLDVVGSFGYMLDGVPANQFDQIPGQDLSRQVVLVHDGRLFTLTFVPDDPEMDAYSEMESLYEMVMDSFSFLRRSESNG